MSTSESLPNRPGDALLGRVERLLAANYEVEQEIGRGATGIVYRARDKRLKRLVAVKVLPPELAYHADIRSRFLREAETAAQLSHPNIVPIYMVEEADDLVFFIMEYVRGENLTRELCLHGTVAEDRARRILRGVADALAYAHARGVVHRDIKPDNILFDAETGRVMVTDFGIARATSDGTDMRLTVAGTAIGTPAYMSPEQCAGDQEVDGRSDLYSLGVVGYQLLSGELPFVAANMRSMLVKHLLQTPQPLSERVAVTRDLNDIIMRCLAKDPADRFATASELVAALDGTAAPIQSFRRKLMTYWCSMRRSLHGRDVITRAHRQRSMRTARRVVVGLIVAAGVLACGRSDAARVQGKRTAVTSTRGMPDSVVTPMPVHIAAPDTLRGLYVNRWAALGDKMWQLIDVARRTEVNALVIDVKDDRGFVLYRSHVPLAQQIGADTNRPMSAKRLAALFDSLRAHHIYPIARIVVAKDPLLAGHQLEWAIKQKADLQPWLDKNGRPWLDPTQRGVWQYAVDLAKEAYAMGFSAAQFDYVRFPDEDRLVHEATFPLAQGRVRAQVIRDQLAFVRSELKQAGIPMTIDVFGLTATDTTDMGIGQKWEAFVDQADVVLPMVYPSHFAPGTYKLGTPNAHPYATIDHAIKDMKRRSAAIAGAAKIVPWYQDFTLGAPHYTAEQVRAQIKAGEDNGVPDWILWNPGSRYTVAALRPKTVRAVGLKSP